MKIYLIGMPGSGKSTLGRKLARELLVEFVDLDNEIEMKEGKSVREIFSGNGEEYFRLAESRMLADWSVSPTSFVMATGGGTPCFFNGIQVINETGLSIFLDVPMSQLLMRLEKKTDRPLLRSSDEEEMEDKLNRLRSARRAIYEQAHITIENPDLSKLMTAIHLRK
jgi:shikimate kinase